MKNEIVLNFEEIGYFAVLCGIVSLLAFLIDFLIYKVQKKPSFLGIIYLGNNSFLLAFLWFVGAAAVGVITHLIGILKINTQTIVTVGVDWPFVFAKIVKYTNQRAEEEEDEQVEEENNG